VTENREYDEQQRNQAKSEPIGNSPSTSAQSSSTQTSSAQSSPPDAARDDAAAGTSSRARGEQGEAAEVLEVDDVRSAANTGAAATMPAAATGGVPVPGDAKGVSVPSVHAAAGTSEASGKVDGVRQTALAPPGKPDGEVDTRPQ
jgi:hypothetical protein